MPISLDSYLGVHQDALKVYGQRTAVLANNIANADTPNYKARDIDFRALLGGNSAAASPALALTTTSSAHVGNPSASSAASGSSAASATSGASADSGRALKYRVPLAPSLDGNTVDVQLEQAAFADNSVRFQAALAFLSDKFKGLMTAITGQ
jgi:flagellar basal-body rod protein FlgB